MNGDLLGEYLDLLCEVDGAPSTGAATAASRASLSRSRFDHVVRSAVGEAPGEFRRRILLERACYSLWRTDAHVIDIAMTAGYESHEGFTRAFSRSYGMSPTQFRRAHTENLGYLRPFELTAPSGIHFQPPRGLRFAGNRKVKPMDILKQMMAHHVDAIGSYIEAIASLDDEVLDTELNVDVEWVDAQPFSLRKLADGLVTEEERYVFAVSGGILPEHRDATIAGLRSRHEVAGESLNDFVADAIDADRLGDTYVMADCPEDGPRTYAATIAHLLTFGAVRRTMAVRAYAALTHDESLGWADPAPALDAAWI